ncbi:MAG: SGNH/GDSL hydrolase family protein, partial [Pirellulales bacterium]|nr:SGNH/GDSL hydrolase family protein [Pirellulales bacterium]
MDARNRNRRLAFLVFLGLLLILGVWGYAHFWLARPMGRGPAGPAVDGDAFDKIWTTRKVLVL